MTIAPLFGDGVRPLETPETKTPAGDAWTAPRMFAVALTISPGLPWDQIRAAHLEAKLNAPIPPSELAYQIRRLGAWAPGRPARFAAVYVRRAEIGRGLSEVVEIDDRRLLIRFEPEEEKAQRRMSWIAAFGVFALAALALMAVISTALSTAEDRDARLGRLEMRTAVRLRTAGAMSRALAQTSAIDNADLADRRLDRVLRDLNWTAEAKRPEARFLAWYWDRGAMAVEVRSADSPFPNSDRKIRRSDHPLGKGLWLFGVGAPVISERVDHTSPDSVRGPAR